MVNTYNPRAIVTAQICSPSIVQQTGLQKLVTIEPALFVSYECDTRLFAVPVKAPL